MTNLTCSMEQEGENVTYSWKAQGQMMNMSYNGSFLPISWSLEERDMSFICIASNPISSNFSRPIFARKLCEGDCLPFLSKVSLYPVLQGNRHCLKTGGHWETTRLEGKRQVL